MLPVRGTSLQRVKTGSSSISTLSDTPTTTTTGAADQFVTYGMSQFALPVAPHLMTSGGSVSPVPGFGASGIVGRKRMIVDVVDETNNSQAAGSTTSSGVSSTVDIDSMRPVAAPRTKRRRTGILDAFNSISLVSSRNKKSRWKADPNEVTATTTLSGSGGSGGCEQNYYIATDQGTDDADSSQAVAEADNVDNSGDYYSSTGSSLGDDDTMNGGDDNDNDMMNNYNNISGTANGNNEVYIDSSCGDSVVSEDRLLSDAELVARKEERKVMLELVFGPSSEFVPQKDPIDVKLKQMIRKSLQNVANINPTLIGTTNPTTSTGTTSSLDDISMDYSPGSIPLGQQHEHETPSLRHSRSSSLPDISMMPLSPSSL